MSCVQADPPSIPRGPSNESSERLEELVRGYVAFHDVGGAAASCWRRVGRSLGWPSTTLRIGSGSPELPDWSTDSLAGEPTVSRLAISLERQRAVRRGIGAFKTAEGTGSGREGEASRRGHPAQGLALTPAPAQPGRRSQRETNLGAWEPPRAHWLTSRPSLASSGRARRPGSGRSRGSAAARRDIFALRISFASEGQTRLCDSHFRQCSCGMDPEEGKRWRGPVYSF